MSALRETRQELFSYFIYEERDSERPKDFPTATRLGCDRSTAKVPILP